MLKTFKYKLYPTKAQKQSMHETTFICSLVYNQCIAQRKETWQQEQKSISCYDQINQLPALKEKDERFQSVFSQVLQDVVRRTDKAFQNFFRRVKAGETPGYPRFKSASRYDSFTYPQSGFKLSGESCEERSNHTTAFNGKKLSLSKIGDVKIKLHRPIEGENLQSVVKLMVGLLVSLAKSNLTHCHLLAKVSVLTLGLKTLRLLQIVSFFHLLKIYANLKRKLSVLNVKYHGARKEASVERNPCGD